MGGGLLGGAGVGAGGEGEGLPAAFGVGGVGLVVEEEGGVGGGGEEEGGLGVGGQDEGEAGGGWGFCQETETGPNSVETTPSAWVRSARWGCMTSFFARRGRCGVRRGRRS